MTCIADGRRKKERDFLLVCDYLDGMRQSDLARKYDLTTARIKVLLEDISRRKCKGLFEMMGVNVANHNERPVIYNE